MSAQNWVRLGLLAALTAVSPQAAMTADPAVETGPNPRELRAYEIPYRLTDTKHVLVRVKLNGKGPFNFIIDTGAPAVILTEAVAKKAGAEAKDGWVIFDTLTLEGGLTIPATRGVAMDMFQLKGMNAMGFAGVELHGVIGYNVLAQFRITYDFTDDKLIWTPVKYDVPEPKRIVDGKKGGGSQGGLEMMGDLMQLLARLSGTKPNFTILPRGFLGAELKAEKDALIVRAVIRDGPADKGGMKVGDRIATVKGKKIHSADDFAAAIQSMPAGSKLKLDVTRGEANTELTIELGKGL